eukprot:snap_masked-scaffold_8-processed-gene-6.25-mRNA-1 protein AED:1.00 eAED:1.00 QI:0/0/0/0/1/1/2/0/149
MPYTLFWFIDICHNWFNLFCEHTAYSVPGKQFEDILTPASPVNITYGGVSVRDIHVRPSKNIFKGNTAQKSIAASVLEKLVTKSECFGLIIYLLLIKKGSWFDDHLNKTDFLWLVLRELTDRTERGKYICSRNLFVLTSISLHTKPLEP